jgi:hypothetical protein
VLGWSIRVTPVGNHDTIIAYWQAGLGGIDWLQEDYMSENHGGYPDRYLVPVSVVCEVIDAPPRLGYGYGTAKNPIVRIPEELITRAGDSLLEVEVWDQS